MRILNKMTYQLLLAVLAFIVIANYQTSAQAPRRSKTRSLGLAIKECNEIAEKLMNSSSTNTMQWEPDFKNDNALLEDNEILMGILPDPPSKARKVVQKAPSNRKIPKKPGDTESPSGKIQLPKTYNAREVYGKRCPSFNHVMYQGSCSNCWAVSVISMINDRVCIYKEDDEPQKFWSAKHLTTCLQKGCEGGWFAEALQYWKLKGLTEGGDFRMKQASGCKAYPHNTAVMKDAICESTCDDGSEISDENKSYGGARYEIKSRDPRDIMIEIYLYGPVIATFDVYDDFARFYKKGVYKKTSTKKKLGAHAAKLYGWGTEKGVPFWYAANSWGTDWGDDGFFKIQRGTNECNIESNIHAGIPLEGMS